MWKYTLETSGKDMTSRHLRFFFVIINFFSSLRIIHLSKLRSTSHVEVANFFCSHSSQQDSEQVEVEECQRGIDALNDQSAKQKGVAPYARMEYGKLIE